MPCSEVYELQPIEYKSEIFPEGIPVLSVEALSTLGWERYAHASIGMTTFGASGPAKAVFEKFGFTIPFVSAKCEQLINFYREKPCPNLVDRPW